jgi:hypothetical protein
MRGEEYAERERNIQSRRWQGMWRTFGGDVWTWVFEVGQDFKYEFWNGGRIDRLGF